MNRTFTRDVLHVTTDKRILNALEGKALNEETIEKVVELRRGSNSSDFSEVLLHCECDDKSCTEIISISIEEYQQVHHNTKNFIVSWNHVHFDLEEIVSSFPNYILAAKNFPPTLNHQRTNKHAQK